MNYLFVCLGGADRSPTAARIAKEFTSIDDVIKYAGMYANVVHKLTQEMADEADIIFALDGEIYEGLLNAYHQPKEKLVCLNILDIYRENDPELVKTLRKRLQDFF